MWPRRKHYTPQPLTPKGNDRFVQKLVQCCFDLFEEMLALMQASHVSADGKKAKHFRRFDFSFRKNIFFRNFSMARSRSLLKNVLFVSLIVNLRIFSNNIRQVIWIKNLLSRFTKSYFRNQQKPTIRSSRFSFLFFLIY